jgi:hypothetical protein
VKQMIALCAFAALVLPPASGVSRVVDGVEQLPADMFELAPLVQWDENELMAQQSTTPVPPPITTTPPLVQPPAAPPPIATTPPVATPPAATPPIDPETEETVAPDAAPEENMSEDDFSIGDIPVVETLELTLDKAKKALDTYVLVREKYKDAQLENFENLQDFVDQTPQGKAFEVDVKAAGFADVTEWNTTITTLSFAYDNSIDDQTTDIKQQITELQADTEMAQDMRERMITALNAMIPSENNKKVLEELKADPAFAEKLKLLESEAE